MNRPAGLLVISLLVLAGCPRNKPPQSPSLDGPAISQHGDSVRLWAYSYDPNSDSLCYLFEWGDGTQSEWTWPAVFGADCGRAHLYADTGLYGARARSKDATYESGWSETLLVRVGEYWPYVPQRPSGPEEVPVGDSAAFQTTTGHPLQKRVAFQFDWGDTVGDWSEFVRADAFYRARHAFARSGTMLLRVRAKDPYEHVTDWSRPESVVVVDTFRLR